LESEKHVAKLVSCLGEVSQLHVACAVVGRHAVGRSPWHCFVVGAPKGRKTKKQQGRSVKGMQSAREVRERVGALSASPEGDVVPNELGDEVCLDEPVLGPVSRTAVSGEVSAVKKSVVLVSGMGDSEEEIDDGDLARSLAESSTVFQMCNGMGDSEEEGQGGLAGSSAKSSAVLQMCNGMGDSEEEGHGWDSVDEGRCERRKRKGRRDLFADQTAQESLEYQPISFDPNLCQALLMPRGFGRGLQCRCRKKVGTAYCGKHQNPFRGTVRGPLPVKVLQNFRERAAGKVSKDKPDRLYTRHHMWSVASKKFTTANSLTDLEDDQYATCMEAVHVYLV
jgi:hypothetical protein